MDRDVGRGGGDGFGRNCSLAGDRPGRNLAEVEDI